MQPKIFGENWYAEAVKLQSKNSDISETNTPFSNNINKTTTLKTHLDHLDSEIVKKSLPSTHLLHIVTKIHHCLKNICRA